MSYYDERDVCYLSDFVYSKTIRWSNVLIYFGA